MYYMGKEDTEVEIMNYCLKISEESFNQEKDRDKAINSKADMLFKWLTLFISIFNISISIMIKEGGVNYKDCWFVSLYILQMVLLLLAMSGIILVNLPQKVKIYPLGTEVLKKVKEEPDKYTGDVPIAYQNILYKDVMTKQLSIKNDRAIKFIFFSNIMLLLSLLCMVSFFGYIMLGM